MLPSNTMPGMIIGYRKNGSPIRLLAGGSEGAVEGGQSGADGQPSGGQADGGADGAEGQQGPQGRTDADWAAMQTALKAARDGERNGKVAARELAKLQAASQTEMEKAINAAKEEGRKEASGLFATRLVSASLTTAATTAGFTYPKDAQDILGHRAAEFVTDEGDVDDKAVTAAVNQLLKDRPHLAATQKAPPNLDGGQRNGVTGETNMDTLIRAGLSRR